jgi:hypothetical protein
MIATFRERLKDIIMRGSAPSALASNLSFGTVAAKFLNKRGLHGTTTLA